MSAYLKDYIDNLRQNAIEQNTPKDLPQQQAQAYKPLTEQITELMQSLPYALKNKPWSMQELVSRLDGKYRDRPHAQLVGIALSRWVGQEKGFGTRNIKESVFGFRQKH